MLIFVRCYSAQVSVFLSTQLHLVHKYFAEHEGKASYFGGFSHKGMADFQPGAQALARFALAYRDTVRRCTTSAPLHIDS